MRTIVLGLSALLFAGPAFADPPNACAAENALYSVRGESGAQLRVFKPPHAQDATTDLAARVSFEGETYWFAFTSSLGYSRNYVGRTGDMIEAARREDTGEDVGEDHQEPEFDGAEIHFFDSAYNVLESLPQAGEPAPAHILASGIGSAIWYSTPRRLIPRDMWDLTGCAED